MLYLNMTPVTRYTSQPVWPYGVDLLCFLHDMKGSARVPLTCVAAHLPHTVHAD